jgi:IclR family transcriptional regulator, acetate operon repressor
VVPVLRGGQMLFIDQVESAHRLRAVSAVGIRFPLESTANGRAALQLIDDSSARLSGVAFDHDGHTAGISAAGVAARTVDGHIVAISVPAPSDRFDTNETQIVDALRDCARSLTS